MRKILLLGGSGNLGRSLARLLLQTREDVALTLAARNEKKLEAVIEGFKNSMHSPNIKGISFDVSNKQALEQALEPVDIVIVASSTIDLVEPVAQSTLKTKTDYFDGQLSSQRKIAALNHLKNEIEKEGRIFITDGGSHPGIPAAMVRLADEKVGPLRVANCFVAPKIDWGNLKVSEGTGEEMMKEFETYDNRVFQKGQWKKLRYRDCPLFDFGDPFGKEYCFPMMMEEIHILPERIPSLEETGFYISGINKVMDYIFLPIVMVGLKLFPRSMATPFIKLFHFGFKFCRPPFGFKLVSECEGPGGKARMELFHEDAYYLTAAPMVACMNQYLDGNLAEPGVYTQAHAVEPTRFFDDLNEMGIDKRMIMD